MVRLLALISASISIGSLAQAVTLVRLSTDDLAQKSTAVVYAKVLDSYGVQQGSLIYTHYHVQVVETWKAGPVPVTEIMLPGGVASGKRQSFAGVPALIPGKSYLMFLWAGKNGSPQLTGLTQGLFDVAPDATGSLIASRPISNEQMLDETGRAVQDQPVRVRFRDFNNQVVTSLKKRVTQ